jgi:hypothetical protein
MMAAWCRSGNNQTTVTTQYSSWFRLTPELIEFFLGASGNADSGSY